MNAQELLAQIEINQQAREENLFGLATKMYDIIVQEMLDIEFTDHSFPSSEVDNFLLQENVTVSKWDFINEFLIPEFQKNGFTAKAVYESIDVYIEKETEDQEEDS